MDDAGELGDNEVGVGRSKVWSLRMVLDVIIESRFLSMGESGERYVVGEGGTMKLAAVLADMP
jgi:hypothetical protein